MSFAPIQHIVIQQGETFEQTIKLAEQLVSAGRYSASPSAVTVDLFTALSSAYSGDTEITIFEWPKQRLAYPVVDAIQEFWIVKTVGSAVSGSKSLVLDSLPVELFLGETVAGKPIDLTGWQCRGQIRRQGDSALSPVPSPLAAFTFTVSPQEGLIQYSLSDAMTSAIPANCTFADLSYFTVSAPQISVAKKQALWTKLQKKAYVFDIEMVLQAEGRVHRQQQGYCFVCGETTL